VTAALVEEIVLVAEKKKAWKITDSTLMSKQKWLFVIGFEYNSPISKATEFLDSCQKWKKCINVLGNNVENDHASVK
jgi:hypothetical protein